MELKDELKKLDSLKMTDEIEFEKQLAYIVETFTSTNDKEAIDDFLKKMLSASKEKIDTFIEQANVKLQLEKVSEIVSMAYISKKYFDKSRNWIYQKINGSIVNGKSAKFSKEEINTLNFALKDIGKSIGSTVIYI